MATADLDTLTCAPAVKPGLRSILRSVRTASPIAHRQKRRMPVSLARDQQRVIQRIAQMRMRDADQFVDSRR